GWSADIVKPLTFLAGLVPASRPTSPAQRREGDRAPQRAWWRGQAGGSDWGSPLHQPLFASLGVRSLSRHFVGEVGDEITPATPARRPGRSFPRRSRPRCRAGGRSG